MAHLWVSVKGPGPSFFPLQGWKVLKCSARAWPHRIGPAWDGNRGIYRELWLLLRGPVLPWNPALCLWVPVGTAVVATAAAAARHLKRKTN